MYRDISFACEKEGLTLFLGGGSCLGAVRHKGFIPWDDDIDLNMLRADYEKLPSALEKHFPGKYKLKGPGLSDEYLYPFVKIEKRGTLIRTVLEIEGENPGIGIDLFPLDCVPDNKLSRLIFGFRNTLVYYIAICVKLYAHRSSPAIKLIRSTKEGRKSLNFRLFLGGLFSFRSYKNWYRKFDRLAQKYKKRKTRCITCSSGRNHFFGEMLPLKEVLPPFDCTFEGLPAKIYGNYDRYLSSLYGDYMQLPPPEKRERHFILQLDFGDGGGEHA